MPVLASLAVRTVLTIVFAVSALVCVRRCVGRDSGADVRGRVNDAAHVLMSAEMIAMVWAWAVPDPYGIQVIVFSTAVAWFAIQATGVPLTRAGLVLATSAGPLPPDVDTGHHRAAPPRTQCLHHAILLATMVWMISPVRSMPGMPAMSASSGIGPVIGAYCFVSATAWIAYAWRTRRDIRTVSSYAAMTAAMGVTLLAMS